MTVTPESTSESSQLVLSNLYVSNAGTLMHLVKGNVGVGLLALPWAIKHAGIVLGPILLSVLAITSASCMVTLVKCSRHFCSKLGVPSLDYGNVAFYCILFGPVKCLQRHATKARFVVNFCLVFTQLGVCCLYVVFVAQNIRQVVAVYWHNAPEDRVFMALLWIPVVLLTFIRDLSKLAWLSAAANVILVAAICMILRFLFTHLVPVETRPFVGSAADFPLFLGTAVFTLEGIGLILPIENAMRNPEDFQKVFYIAIVLIITLYEIIAFFGFLTFGAAICGSVTLNLPAGVLFYEMVRIFYSVIIFISYGIQFYVAFEIVWSPINDKIRPQRLCCELLTRTGFATLTCLLAISIPYIGDFNSLIGATGSIVLQYMLPSVIEVMTFHSQAGITEYPELISTEHNGEPLLSSGDQNTTNQDDALSEPPTGLSVWTVVKNCLIFTLALTGMLTGTVLSIRKIVYDLENYSSGSTCSGGLGKHSSVTTQHVNVTAPSILTVAP